tara:strand:+ start:1321 stop:3021 length:1701 start_codon:yes stop_codon:yes gene_type:complete
MKFFVSSIKIILYTIIFLGIFNLSYGRTTQFNQNAKSISNYFSGLISFDNFNYTSSKGFFKKLDESQVNNKKYSSRFIQSLINLGKHQEAYRYSKKLEDKKQSNFESNIFLGLYEFKRQNYKKSEIYFKKLKSHLINDPVSNMLLVSLDAWTQISQVKNKDSLNLLNYSNNAYANLQILQKAFGKCYISSNTMEEDFKSIIENEEYNFSRYNFFISNYYFNKNQKVKALNLINSASSKYPGNLLINQYKKALQNGEKNKNVFNCQNSSDILAETLYILANILSSQENYQLSNFYINLSKFLNSNFISYDSLLAENFFVLERYNDAKIIYKKLFKGGSVYKWYAGKKIAQMMDKQKKTGSINFLRKIYNDIQPGIYEKFDFANFLRNKEKYDESIKLYSEILLKIKLNHELYPSVLERRGMAYERNDQWKLGEKDLLDSLKIKPNEPYVMNYLAYSWVEKNKNIEEALEMLRDANDLKKNNGYITDSLGWALFKSKYFLESKKYLEKAIILMPRDPVINDHYADCLWMNNYKIQARYYWNNVLLFESAEKDLKEKVKQKIIFGLSNT